MNPKYLTISWVNPQHVAAFCPKCGQALVYSLKEAGYDALTGAPMYYCLVSCPETDSTTLIERISQQFPGRLSLGQKLDLTLRLIGGMFTLVSNTLADHTNDYIWAYPAERKGNRRIRYGRADWEDTIGQKNLPVIGKD